MLKKLAIVGVAAVYLSGCTTTDPYTGEQKVSNTAGGAMIGAGLGALGGLAVGGSPVGRRNAALIGAGIGALAGGAIGNYMDSQEAELRAQLQGTGISVTRAGDRIILNMPSNITFATDQDAISPAFFPTLNSVAVVLRDKKASTSYIQRRLQIGYNRAASIMERMEKEGIVGPANHAGKREILRER